MTINQTRRSLYRAARALGDVQAARLGPASYGRRVVRRTAYRNTNRVLRQMLRGLGL